MNSAVGLQITSENDWLNPIHPKLSTIFKVVEKIPQPVYKCDGLWDVLELSGPEFISPKFQKYDTIVSASLTTELLLKIVVSPWQLMLEEKEAIGNAHTLAESLKSSKQPNSSFTNNVA